MNLNFIFISVLQSPLYFFYKFFSISLLLLFITKPLLGSTIYDRFRQIETDHFILTYPNAFESRANNVANMSEEAYSNIQKFYPDQVSQLRAGGKWNIYIDAHQLQENGFVSGVPRHSTIYLYSSVPLDWMKKLIIHELAHTVQNDILIRQLSAAGYYVFGELVAALMKQFGLGNNWVLEGQAVNIETILSHYGRGRNPHFSMEFKSILLDRGLESFPDYYNHLSALKQSWYLYPNQYVYGYFLSTYLAKHYGQSIWTKLYEGTSTFPFFSFDASVKYFSGKDIYQIHQEMLAEVQSLFKDQLNKITLTEKTLLNKTNKKHRVDYEFPLPLKNGNILAIKSTYKNILANEPKSIILIDTNGAESYIAPYHSTQSPYHSSQSYLSLGDQKLTWVQNTPHSRFNTVSYRDIYIRGIHPTSLSKKLTSKAHYLYSAISPNDQYVAGVSLRKDGFSQINIIHIQSKTIVESFFEDDKITIADLSWVDENTLIYIKTSINTQENQIEKLHIPSKQRTLLHQSYDFNKNPIIKNNILYFSSSYSGIDNIYAKNLANNSLYQVTSTKYGAYYPKIDDQNRLYYSDYSGIKGFNIAYIPISIDSFKLINSIPMSKVDYFNENQDYIKNIKNIVEMGVNYEPIKYKSYPHNPISTFKIRDHYVMPKSILFNQLELLLSFSDIYQFLKLQIQLDYLNFQQNDLALTTSIITPILYFDSKTDFIYSQNHILLNNKPSRVYNYAIHQIFSLPLSFNYSYATFNITPLASLSFSRALYEKEISIRISENSTLSSKEKILELSIMNYQLLSTFSLPLFNHLNTISYSHDIDQPNNINAFFLSSTIIVHGFYGIDRLSFSTEFENRSTFILANASLPSSGYNEDTILDKVSLKVSHQFPILTRGHLGPLVQMEYFQLIPFYHITFPLNSPSLPSSFHSLGLQSSIVVTIIGSLGLKMQFGISLFYRNVGNPFGFSTILGFIN